MKYQKCILYILVLLLICSCSTPYQPKGMLGGYSEEKILANMYKVEFKGNQHTEAQLIQHYLLYRCAELTKEKRYLYFTIINEERHFNEQSVRPERDVSIETRSSASGGVRTIVNPDLQTASTSTNYTGVYYIKLLNDVEEKDKDVIFNANEVIDLLEDMIKK